MSLSLPLARAVLESENAVAWAAVAAHAWEVCSAPVDAASWRVEIARRDRQLAALDLILATGAVDLWSSYEDGVEKTAAALERWWRNCAPARAVLVLDGLSLREVPLILSGAEAHGLEVVAARPTGAELPGETRSFARALGFGQRSALSSGGRSPCFAEARTDTTNVPWEECTQRITPDPAWFFWHHWPDERLHALAEPGHGGAAALSAETHKVLASDGFWSFIKRLATGRRLVITSDHGYGVTSDFPDASESQASYLKDVFGGGRSASGGDASVHWHPPLDLRIINGSGDHRLVLGRRKWRSRGGYPSLAHGGLTVLEVLSPFIEIAPRH
jgi:hypothetical protein